MAPFLTVIAASAPLADMQSVDVVASMANGEKQHDKCPTGGAI